MYKIMGTNSQTFVNSPLLYSSCRPHPVQRPRQETIKNRLAREPQWTNKSSTTVECQEMFKLLDLDIFAIYSSVFLSCWQDMLDILGNSAGSHVVKKL